MSHNPTNYQQNYQNYYQNTSEQYEEYYEDETQDLKENYDETPPDLQVPNARLYAEGYPDVTELYARNTSFAEPQQQVESTNLQYMHEYNPGPNDYIYSVPQHSHRTRVPNNQLTAPQGTSNYSYSHHHTVYPTCPLATSHSLQGNADESSYIPKMAVNSMPGRGRGTLPSIEVNTFQGMGENNYNMEGYNENQKYEAFDKRKMYQIQENYGNYYSDLRPGYNVREYGANQEMYVDYKGKRHTCYGNRMGRSGVLRKYPVTVKTPKYVSKNQVVSPINKRPSALCLPVVTQPDPGLVRRKSKTNHSLKRTYDQSQSLPSNSKNPPENYAYAAHQMDSEGDMNPNAMGQGLENLLDQFESKVMLNENQDTGDGEGVRSEMKEHSVKEFSKFMKPRIPSSIKAKQDRISKMKSSLNMSGVSIQPKMKKSLDKLLNRLQKCEISESGEKLAERSYETKEETEEKKSTGKEDNKHRSFNYESLSRKLTPRNEDPDDEDKSKSILNKPSTSLTTSLDNKKSSRLLRSMDDNCALDLHRSKSYIVDLIDRALSKELGTVPRGQAINQDMTPKRAVTTISRHRQSGHKELCYELTAALTDSFISSATAPEKQNTDQCLNPTDSNDSGKLCTTFGEDTNYIKQLKQLRWGHIRHIQHEARKLADLEEFLEKCGEIEY